MDQTRKRGVPSEKETPRNFSNRTSEAMPPAARNSKGNLNRDTALPVHHVTAKLWFSLIKELLSKGLELDQAFLVVFARTSDEQTQMEGGRP